MPPIVMPRSVTGEPVLIPLTGPSNPEDAGVCPIVNLLSQGFWRRRCRLYERYRGFPGSLPDCLRTSWPRNHHACRKPDTATAEEALAGRKTARGREPP